MPSAYSAVLEFLYNTVNGNISTKIYYSGQTKPKKQIKQSLTPEVRQKGHISERGRKPHFVCNMATGSLCEL